jgi:hypothetical protein
MWNGVSFFKPYRPSARLSSRLRTSAARFGFVLLMGGTVAALAGTTAPPLPPLNGTPAPALARIFTPRHAADGVFTVTVVDRPIEAAWKVVRQSFEGFGLATGPDGKPTVTEEEPLTIFGSAGSYNRSKLAGLYAGRRALVSRTPITQDGRTVASLTLVSPYPDATLQRLEPGTLAILLRVDALDGLASPTRSPGEPPASSRPR